VKLKTFYVGSFSYVWAITEAQADVLEDSEELDQESSDEDENEDDLQPTILESELPSTEDADTSQSI
jgi:hypothetical protein